MAMPTRPTSPGVRPISVPAGDLTLSGLLAEPRHTPSRAVVVCLHGGGMSAGYFDAQARPGLSLLALGASLGYTVLALDRPGYGASAAVLPEGQTLAEQAATLGAALGGLHALAPLGAGVFLLAHSYGGKLALATAAGAAGDALIGLDISGCGSRYAPDTARHIGAQGRASWKLNWGPLRLYPPGTFRSSGALVAPMPAREQRGWARWPERYAETAARVRCPVRLTFAEYEAWWRHDDTALAELLRPFGTGQASADRLPEAGHNVSLGWSARSYHLRALGFLEECLARRESAPAAAVVV